MGFGWTFPHPCFPSSTARRKKAQSDVGELGFHVLLQPASEGQAKGQRSEDRWGAGIETPLPGMGEGEIKAIGPSELQPRVEG